MMINYTKKYYLNTIEKGIKKLLNCNSVPVSQLEEIESIIRKKIKIVQEYKKQLKNLKHIIFAEEEENSRNVYWQVGIRVKTDKNKLVKFLAKNKIDTRNFFFSIKNQPCLKNIKHN